jgi:integrase
VTAKRANGEGSVFRRKDGRCVASMTYRDAITGRAMRKDFYGRTKAAAKAKRADALRALENGQVVVQTDETVATYTRKWSMTHLPNSDRKPSTINQYRKLISAFVLPTLGHLRLADVTPLTIEKWIGQLRSRGLTSTTVRAAFSVLAVMMKTAVRDGAIRVNPCDSVKRPSSDTSESSFLSSTQIRSLLKAAPGNLRPLLVVTAYTGMRIGEVLALRWTDLDLESASLTVRHTLARGESGPTLQTPKTKKSVRVIPLVPVAMEAIKDQRRLQVAARLIAGNAWHDLDLVFATQIGTPEDYRNVLRRYQEVARPLGVAGGFHALRHAAATMLVDSGVPPTVVSAILGHSRTAVTLDTYAHVIDGSDRDALNKLEEIYGN